MCGRTSTTCVRNAAGPGARMGWAGALPARRRRYCIGSRGWDAFLCRLASNRTLIWRHHGVHIAGFRERLVGRTRWARSHTRLVTYHQDLVARVCAVSATSAVLVLGLQLLMVPRRWCECSLLPRARRKKTTTACVVQLVRAQLRRWKRAQLAATPALRPDLGVAVSEAPVWVSLRICKLLTAPDHGARGAWPALAPLSFVLPETRKCCPAVLLFVIAMRRRRRRALQELSLDCGSQLCWPRFGVAVRAHMQDSVCLDCCRGRL